eukprot:sb/3464266/
MKVKGIHVKSAVETRPVDEAIVVLLKLFKLTVPQQLLLYSPRILTDDVGTLYTITNKIIAEFEQLQKITAMLEKQKKMGESSLQSAPVVAPVENLPAPVPVVVSEPPSKSPSPPPPEPVVVSADKIKVNDNAKSAVRQAVANFINQIAENNEAKNTANVSQILSIISNVKNKEGSAAQIRELLLKAVNKSNTASSSTEGEPVKTQSAATTAVSTAVTSKEPEEPAPVVDPEPPTPPLVPVSVETSPVVTPTKETPDKRPESEVVPDTSDQTSSSPVTELPAQSSPPLSPADQPVTTGQPPTIKEEAPASPIPEVVSAESGEIAPNNNSSSVETTPTTTASTTPITSSPTEAVTRVPTAVGEVSRKRSRSVSKSDPGSSDDDDAAMPSLDDVPAPEPTPAAPKPVLPIQPPQLTKKEPTPHQAQGASPGVHPYLLSPPPMYCRPPDIPGGGVDPTMPPHFPMKEEMKEPVVHPGWPLLPPN